MAAYNKEFMKEAIRIALDNVKTEREDLSGRLSYVTE